MMAQDSAPLEPVPAPGGCRSITGRAYKDANSGRAFLLLNSILRRSGFIAIRLFLVARTAAGTERHHARPPNNQIFGNKSPILQLASSTHEIANLDVRESNAFI